MSQEKELKKLRIYLKTTQLNQINDLDMEGSLSMKIEWLIDVAMAVVEEEEQGDDLWLEGN